jgi:hypothetical protein
LACKTNNASVETEWYFSLKIWRKIFLNTPI